ncbi:Uncharacterised protein [Vibrio cholerae]|nr:Uncharacterised protein [Vibrio cholerae]CSH85720.1 Uncharacterised protein [Vibrio cholerae]
MRLHCPVHVDNFLPHNRSNLHLAATRSTDLPSHRQSRYQNGTLLIVDKAHAPPTTLVSLLPDLVRSELVRNGRWFFAVAAQSHVNRHKRHTQYRHNVQPLGLELALQRSSLM